jgi:hypothetical protein
MALPLLHQSVPIAYMVELIDDQVEKYPRHAEEVLKSKLITQDLEVTLMPLASPAVLLVIRPNLTVTLPELHEEEELDSPLTRLSSRRNTVSSKGKQTWIHTKD